MVGAGHCRMPLNIGLLFTNEANVKFDHNTSGCDCKQPCDCEIDHTFSADVSSYLRQQYLPDFPESLFMDYKLSSVVDIALCMGKVIELMKTSTDMGDKVKFDCRDLIVMYSLIISKMATNDKEYVIIFYI